MEDINSGDICPLLNIMDGALLVLLKTHKKKSTFFNNSAAISLSGIRDLVTQDNPHCCEQFFGSSYFLF